MRLAQAIQRRLRRAGWTLDRTKGSHQTWKHPNGASYTVPVRMQDRGRKLMNCYKAIERLESKR